MTASPESSLAGGDGVASASVRPEPGTVYWIGTEDDQQRERMKACRARRKRYGQSCCSEKDGSCDECEDDMALALQVTKEKFEAHVRSSHD